MLNFIKNFFKKVKEAHQVTEITTEPEWWEEFYHQEPPFCESHNQWPCEWCHQQWTKDNSKNNEY